MPRPTGPHRTSPAVDPSASGSWTSMPVWMASTKWAKELRTGSGRWTGRSSSGISSSCSTSGCPEQWTRRTWPGVLFRSWRTRRGVPWPDTVWSSSGRQRHSVPSGGSSKTSGSLWSRAQSSPSNAKADPRWRLCGREACRASLPRWLRSSGQSGRRRSPRHARPTGTSRRTRGTYCGRRLLRTESGPSVCAEPQPQSPWTRRRRR
mmetsp:Transcript_56806/g.101329  ORF Transcript_56806/g.101329 Transcript_56806/m.101329 type:complete len:206 (-) Transcript_56806:2187-2804(-)